MAEPTMPTPTADAHQCTGPHEDGRDEACTCSLGRDHDHQEHDARRADEAELWKPAAPPSITDMAPGTTFSARFRDRSAFHVFMRIATRGLLVSADNEFTHDYFSIDPSTIRDVTPPKG